MDHDNSRAENDRPEQTHDAPQPRLQADVDVVIRRWRETHRATAMLVRDERQVNG